METKRTDDLALVKLSREGEPLELEVFLAPKDREALPSELKVFAKAIRKMSVQASDVALVEREQLEFSGCHTLVVEFPKGEHAPEWNVAAHWPVLDDLHLQGKGGRAVLNAEVGGARPRLHLHRLVFGDPSRFSKRWKARVVTLDTCSRGVLWMMGPALRCLVCTVETLLVDDKKLAFANGMPLVDVSKRPKFQLSVERALARCRNLEHLTLSADTDAVSVLSVSGLRKLEDLFLDGLKPKEAEDEWPNLFPNLKRIAASANRVAKVAERVKPHRRPGWEPSVHIVARGVPK